MSGDIRLTTRYNKQGSKFEVIVHQARSVQIHSSWLFKPKSVQHVISPFSNTAESFIKIMRIKEVIFNIWSFNV